MARRIFLFISIHLFCGSLFFAQGEILQQDGDWFSHPEKRGLGEAFYHLRLEKNGKFRMHRILNHPNLHWEEARYEGKWEKKETIWILFPYDCRYYTTNNLSNRWALLRKFDCDHMEWTFYRKSLDKFVLNPNEYGKSEETMFYPPPYPGPKRWFLILHKENSSFGWGIGVQEIKGMKWVEIWKEGKKKGAAKGKLATETTIELEEVLAPEFHGELLAVP